jgi:hypothetical protein
MTKQLIARAPAIVNLGLGDFAAAARQVGAAALDIAWRPIGDGDPRLAWLLARLAGDPAEPESPGTRIDRANRQAVARVLAAQPMLVDVVPHAREAFPDMGRTLLHAGPPIAWERMCGPMQGAAIGALLYEGWAADPDAARALLARGEIAFSPCHDHGAVGPMSGIISPSMPLFKVRNDDAGNVAFSNINEGIGKVLRFGANGPEVIERLRWIETALAPALKRAVTAIDGGINLKAIQSRALAMGDEVHSRNAASTSLFLEAITIPLIQSDLDDAMLREVLRSIDGNSQFFLNLSMVSAKATMDAAHGVAASSMVTAMARNGVAVGIRVSGLGGRWFEAAADTPVGLFFPGFKAGDANADLGDSAITETAGFGGFSLAASPALVQLVGGSADAAVAYSQEMYDITIARNPALALPRLDFAGAPTGVDVRKVVDSGIRPVFTTGMAHKVAGIGQVGAGIVRAPMTCFSQALIALAESLGVG